MMAGSDTTKRSLLWALQLLANRPDIQRKAHASILESGIADDILTSPSVAHTHIPYIDALAKEVGRYFVVLRLALPKATHGTVTWKGARIPPRTLLFLNTWACARDTEVFADADEFDPERWLDGDVVHRHQFAFGMGGRMCVASHVASKALYTVFLHLVAHFEVLPAGGGVDSTAWDPLEGLLSKGNHQAAPAATFVRLVPRNAEATRRMLAGAAA